jgi:hypothetical protein
LPRIDPAGWDIQVARKTLPNKTSHLQATIARLSTMHAESGRCGEMACGTRRKASRLACSIVEVGAALFAPPWPGIFSGSYQRSLPPPVLSESQGAVDNRHRERRSTGQAAEEMPAPARLRLGGGGGAPERIREVGGAVGEGLLQE